MRTDLEIRWEIPPTSPGPLGRLERFMGPGTSRSESAVELLGAGGCAVLLAAGVWSSGIHRDWSGLQWAVVVLIGLDLLGGSSPTRRTPPSVGTTVRTRWPGAPACSSSARTCCTSP